MLFLNSVPFIQSPYIVNIAQSEPSLQVSTINSVPLILSDMQKPNDAKLSGVPDYYSWANGPQVNMGNDPGNFTAITAWGQVYREAGFDIPPNTRVNIRNMETYILLKSTGQWIQVQGTTDVAGAAFVEDFAGNASVGADVRKEADGSVSVRFPIGHNFHFWPNQGRGTFPQGDLAAVFTTFQARLIPDDPSKPDDRNTAHIIAGCGADYWIDTTTGWANFTTNRGVAGGRMKYVRKDWQAFNMTTASADQLQASPPPLE